jgi:hypothetical protein
VQIPSLGVGAEWQMRADPALHEVLYPSIRSFNRWVKEDWGWGADGRIFSTALMSLADLPQALAELERLIADGVKLVQITTGPIDGRSPADPHFDPFWARVQEAGLVTVFHIGATGFNAMQAAPWATADPPSHRSHRSTPSSAWVSALSTDRRTDLPPPARLFGAAHVDRGVRCGVAPPAEDARQDLPARRPPFALAFGKPSLKPSETFNSSSASCPFRGRHRRRGTRGRRAMRAPRLGLPHQRACMPPPTCCAGSVFSAAEQRHHVGTPRAAATGTLGACPSRASLD